MMILIETDHNAYTEDTKNQRKIQMAEEMREAAGEDEQVANPSIYISITIFLSIYLSYFLSIYPYIDISIIPFIYFLFSNPAFYLQN